MRRVTGGNKHSRSPDTADEPPPAKRQKVSDDAMVDAAGILADFADTSAVYADPEIRHVMEQILTLLQNDPNSLNLSGFLPATLESVAPLIPERVLASVTHLTLPANLYALPALCARMQGLQRLVLQGFCGTQLDLLKWPLLQQVSGSVHFCTEEIHVQGNVDLALTSERITKVRCFRHFGDGQVRRHALPGHQYYKVLPGRVAPDLGSLNGAANFTGTTLPIECRHIANYVRPHLEAKDIPQTLGNGYVAISSVNDLQQKITIDSNMRYVSEVQSSRAYHGVSDSHFGQWAMQQMAALKSAAQAKQLPANQTISKSFYAGSSNHVMVLVFRYKPDKDEQFVEILMDPNLTLTHKRNTEFRLDSIGTGARQWRFSSMLNVSGLSDYFFDASTPALLFVDPSPRANGESPEINLQFAYEGIENFSYIFMLFGLTECVKGLRTSLEMLYKNKSANAVSIYKALQAPRWKSDWYGLAVAVFYGYTDTVRAHMASIRDFLDWYRDRSSAENQLPPDFELKLICPYGSLAEWYDKTSPSHRPTFRALAEEILELYKARQISGETCVLLLQGSYNNKNLIESAFSAQDPETLLVAGNLLTDLHTRGALKLEQCRQILDSRVGSSDAADTPLAWEVLNNCPKKVLDVYEEILKSLCCSIRRTDWEQDLITVWSEPSSDEEKKKLDNEFLLPLLVGQLRDTEVALSTLRAQGKDLLATRLLDVLEKSKS